MIKALPVKQEFLGNAFIISIRIYIRIYIDYSNISIDNYTDPH